MGGFPARHAGLGILDAVIDGVPDNMKKRVREIVDDIFIDLCFLADDIKFDRLSEFFAHIPDKPAHFLEQRGDGIIRIDITMSCSSLISEWSCCAAESKLSCCTSPKIGVIDHHGTAPSQFHRRYSAGCQACWTLTLIKFCLATDSRETLSADCCSICFVCAMPGTS